jgi:Amt family ammonium transporter
MIGGAWGVIATGLFTSPERLEAAFGMSEHVGWFYSWSRQSGDFTLLGIQLISVLFIFGWTSVLMGTFFYILNMFGLLRISPLEEEVGMDISRHKGSAYNNDGSAHHEKVNELNMSRRKLNIPDDKDAGSAEKEEVEKDASAEKEEVEKDESA